MRMNPKMKKLLLVVVVVFVVSALGFACMSYKSVKTTALLGKQLEYPGGKRDTGDLCEFYNDRFGDDIDCKIEKESSGLWMKQVNIIKAYAVELEQFIGNDEDIEYDQAYASAVTGLSEVDWSVFKITEISEGIKEGEKIKEAINGLADAIIQAVKKKKLGEVIKTVDPALQSQKEGSLFLAKENIKLMNKLKSQINMKISLDIAEKNCGKTVSDPENLRCEDACDFALALACRDFDKKMAPIVEKTKKYEKDMAAFIDAHNTLFLNASELGGKKMDKKLFNQIIGIVKTAYDAFKK